MVVVDTSVWIAAFRDPLGAPGVYLRQLLDDDAVGLPSPVRIELLAGTGWPDRDRMLRNLSALPRLVPSGTTWSLIESWTIEAARVGERFGIVDLLVAALAAEEESRVWSLDRAFARMAARGWIMLLESEA